MEIVEIYTAIVGNFEYLLREKDVRLLKFH